jgi:hypothetical protein
MTDVIQRNAANMLAISLQFFMRAAAVQDIKPATPLSGAVKATSPFVPSNCSTATMLAPA